MQAAFPIAQLLIIQEPSILLPVLLQTIPASHSIIMPVRSSMVQALLPITELSVSPLTRSFLPHLYFLIPMEVPLTVQAILPSTMILFYRVILQVLAPLLLMATQPGTAEPSGVHLPTALQTVLHLVLPTINLSVPL